jgi:hypothetical protein
MIKIKKQNKKAMVKDMNSGSSKHWEKYIVTTVYFFFIPVFIRYELQSTTM